MKGTATSRLDERRSRNKKKKKKGRKWNAQGLFQFSPRRYVISGWEEISQAQEKSRTTLIPKIPPCLRRSFLASRISSFSLGWRVARNHSNQESTRYIPRWEDLLTSQRLSPFLHSHFSFFFCIEILDPLSFQNIVSKIFIRLLRNDNKFSSDGRAVKGINCMKFSQLNARVRKKRKGKQILQVLPALLFSLPRYITFEIPVRRAESTKRGGSRLVSSRTNTTRHFLSPLPSPRLSPFLIVCTFVRACIERFHAIDREISVLSIFSKPGSLSPVSSVHGKLKRIPFSFFFFL